MLMEFCLFLLKILVLANHRKSLSPILKVDCPKNRSTRWSKTLNLIRKKIKSSKRSSMPNRIWKAILTVSRRSLMMRKQLHRFRLMIWKLLTRLLMKLLTGWKMTRPVAKLISMPNIMNWKRYWNLLWASSIRTVDQEIDLVKKSLMKCMTNYDLTIYLLWWFNVVFYEWLLYLVIEMIRIRTIVRVILKRFIDGVVIRIWV